jgi:hypothetical protein
VGIIFSKNEQLISGSGIFCFQKVHFHVKQQISSTSSILCIPMTGKGSSNYCILTCSALRIYEWIQQMSIHQEVACHCYDISFLSSTFHEQFNISVFGHAFRFCIIKHDTTLIQ